MKTLGDTHIKVFVTRTLKFRVRIVECDKPGYEVTIGSKSWREGKGRKYTEAIKTYMQHIIDELKREAERT